MFIKEKVLSLVHVCHTYYEHTNFSISFHRLKSTLSDAWNSHCKVHQSLCWNNYLCLKVLQESLFFLLRQSNMITSLVCYTSLPTNLDRPKKCWPGSWNWMSLSRKHIWKNLKNCIYDLCHFQTWFCFLRYQKKMQWLCSVINDKIFKLRYMVDGKYGLDDHGVVWYQCLQFCRLYVMLL